MRLARRRNRPLLNMLITGATIGLLLLVLPTASYAATCTITGGGIVQASTLEGPTGCGTAAIADGDTIQVNAGATLEFDSMPNNSVPPAASATPIILGGLDIRAGATVDLKGLTLKVADGNVTFNGTEAGGVATLKSTVGRGTLTITAPGTSSALELIRGQLTNVDVTGANSSNFKMIVPSDATALVTTTLTNSTIDMSASTSIDPATMVCGFNGVDVCEPFTLTGDSSSKVVLLGNLENALPKQLKIDVAMQVASSTPTWTLRMPSTLPSDGLANAFIRFTANPTKLGGGAFTSFTISSDWINVAPAAALGTTVTEIAAPNVSIFTGTDFNSGNIAHRTDTTVSPQLFNAFQGPVLTSTTVPVLSGTMVEGSVVTASAATWNATPDSVTYSWYSKAAGASSFSLIAGAAASTYTPTAALVGGVLKVRATAAKAGHVDGTAESAASTITAAKITNVAAPSITGSMLEGTIVTASAATWSVTPDSVTYAWFSKPTGAAAFAAISGATASTFTPQQAHVGALRVQVTAIKAGYLNGTAESAEKTVIAAVITNITSPTITGTPAVGSTLTVVPGTWSQTEGVTYSYEWKARAKNGGSAFGRIGVTSSVYVPDSSREDHYLSVEVTAKRAGYRNGSATSAEVLIPTIASSFRLTGPEKPIVAGVPFKVGVADLIRVQGFNSDCRGVSLMVSCESALVPMPMDVVARRSAVLTISRELPSDRSLDRVSRSLSLDVQSPTVSDVLIGDRELGISSESGVKLPSFVTPNVWKPDCASITGAVFDGFLTWNIALGQGVRISCRPGMLFPSYGDLNYTYKFGTPFLDLSIEPSHDNVSGSLVVPFTFEGFTVRPIIKYSTNGAAGSSATSAAGNVIDATQPLRCPTLPAGATDVNYAWLGAVGIAPATATLPLANVPVSGKATCFVSYKLNGQLQAISAAVVIDGGVRVGATAFTNFDFSKSRAARAAAKPQTQMHIVRLQASARRVVQVKAYRRIVTKSGATSSTRYSLRSTRTVVLRRGNQAIGMKLPIAKPGYRFVVTPIRWRSKADHTVVRGSSLVLDVR